MQEKNKVSVPSTQEQPGGKDATGVALIADLQLGQIEEVYTLDRSLRVFMIFLVLVALFLFAFGLWIFTSQWGFPASLAWSLSLVLVPLLLCFLVRYQFGGMRVYICTHGLLYFQHKKSASIRWDKVRRIEHRLGARRGNQPYIRLISQHGSQFDFKPPDRTSRLLATLQAKGTQYGFEVSAKS